MKKKIFLSDFDGTLVNKDILDVICGLVGKEQESHDLNMDFINGKVDGLPTLKKRIDFLKGVSLTQINDLLNKEPYLIDGAKELFAYLKNKGIITVIHSGNILPVLEFYQNYLGVDYVIGTSPRVQNGIIQGIELSDFNGRNFKVDGCLEIINTLGIAPNDIIAIGDSPSDQGVFEISNIKFAINPKGNIADYASYIIKTNLKEVISILNEND